MPVAIVTGSGGLVGSESVRHFVECGFDVVGIDNDMRAVFFGPDASTGPQTRRLEQQYPREFRAIDLDVRDADGVARVFHEHAKHLELVVHAAAQPSHDWAGTDPRTDFSVNATGTLNLLEATRTYKHDATFIFTSTNKVYGDLPNGLPLRTLATRYDLSEDHEYFHGIDTSMGIDGCLHSLFGASKVAADVLVQEYGRYFHMPTVSFRGGCLTGPNHAGAELHGFLAYLMRCTVTGTPYTVFGYQGRQVRDNIHSGDLVHAFSAFHAGPRPGAVYNIGGGRESSCSMLEAIALCERIADRELDWKLEATPRVGDHRWWITDLEPFRRDYPQWQVTRGVEEILLEIFAQNVEQWSA